MIDTSVVERRSWLRRRVESAIRGGLTRAYDTVKVDPDRFLMQLRVAHDLPAGAEAVQIHPIAAASIAQV